MEDRWLSVEEIAEYLGVSKDTVYGWITTKGMPAHRLGRLWKFKRETVDAWVESGGANAAEGPCGPEGRLGERCRAPNRGSRKTHTSKRGGEAK